MQFYTPKPNNTIGGSKLVTHMGRLEKWLEGHSPGPLVVEVAATHGCNHNCIHCGFQQFDRFSEQKKFLDALTFKKFIDDFADMGGVEIYFAGNGEPLLNPLIDDWIAYIHEKGISCALSSNGVLFDKIRQMRILPYTKWIRFSVNGGDPDTYAKIHQCQREDFERLTTNIAQAVEYRNRNNFDTRLVIQSLIYEQNWHSLNNLIAEHTKIGADLLILRNVTFKDNPNAIPPPHIIEALKEVVDVPNVQVRWETFGVNAPDVGWHKCYGINFRTNMDDRGNLFACLCPEAVYGNIHELSFREIWNSDRKKETFSKIEKGEYIPQCKSWCPTGFDNIYIENYLEGNGHGR